MLKNKKLKRKRKPTCCLTLQAVSKERDVENILNIILTELLNIYYSSLLILIPYLPIDSNHIKLQVGFPEICF